MTVHKTVSIHMEATNANVDLDSAVQKTSAQIVNRVNGDMNAMKLVLVCRKIRGLAVQSMDIATVILVGTAKRVKTILTNVLKGTAVIRQMRCVRIQLVHTNATAKKALKEMEMNVQ